MRIDSPQTVDVRKYTEKIATGVVDDELVARVMDGLQRAISLQLNNADISQFIPLNHSEYADFILGPSSQLPAFDHILGPKELTKAIIDICSNHLAMFHYQKFMNKGSPIDLHCRMCCPS